MRLVPTLLAVLLMLLNSSAAIYYVDYATGLDSNSGTNRNSPWKRSPGDAGASAAAAATALQPGDTVKFKGGVVYSGGITISRSGTAEKPIVYDGNTGEDWGTGKAIIDRNFALNSEIISLPKGVSHIRIDGLELRNAGGYADDDPVVLDAANGVYGNSTNAIRTPRPGWALNLQENNTNIYCANLYIHHLGNWHSTIGWDGRSVSGVGIQMKSPDSVVVTNCEITKVGAAGMGIYATTVARDVLVTDCYLHDDIPNWAMDIAPQGVNAVLKDIIITKTRFIDLWSDWSGTPDDPAKTGTTAPHQNYIFFRTANMVSSWTNVFVTRCYFGEASDEHVGSGGTASIFLSTGPSVNIYNNIFNRPWSYTGIIFIGYPVPAGMKQIVRIYNNTFYRGSGTQIMSAQNDIAEARELYIENNVIINSPGMPGNAVMFAAGGAYYAPKALNHNCYWSPDWTSAQMYVAVPGNQGYRTVSTLQSLGFETNGFYKDPKLMRLLRPSSQRDFRPQTGSPLVGAGKNLSQYFSVDYEGTPRPATGPWAIGAYEQPAAPVLRPPSGLKAL